MVHTLRTKCNWRVRCADGTLLAHTLVLHECENRECTIEQLQHATDVGNTMHATLSNCSDTLHKECTRARYIPPSERWQEAAGGDILLLEPADNDAARCGTLRESIIDKCRRTCS